MTSAGSSEAPGPGGPEAGGEGLLGRVLDGRYRIDAVLGKGGVGVVYRAEHTKLARPVAIKVLHEYFGEREDLRLRFEREAKVLSALAHPHVVAITDYGIAEGMPYLAMELLVGQTLGALLAQRRAPDPATAVDIARGILRGLAFAHARGVLHRDLKPANVFLQRLPDDPYHVKLLDFGLAKILEAEDEGVDELTLTRQGTVLGTPAYMSPEQASGATVDAPTDIYSAGCVVFQLFAGRPPYEAETRPDLIRMHMLDPIPKLSEVCPGLDPAPELEALLTKALAKDPRMRFADAGEMLAALDALPRPVVAGEGDARPPTGPTPAPRSASSSYAATIRARSGSGGPEGSGEGPAPGSAPRGRFRWVGPAVGLLGLAVAGVGAFLAWSTAEPGEDAEIDGLDVFEEVGMVAPDRVDRGRGAERAAAEPSAEDEGSPAAAAGDEPGSADEGDPEAPEADETEEAQAAAEGDAPAEGASVDDRPPGRYLLAGGLPRALRPYWARVKRGRPLSRAHHRNLRKYQQRAPRDPRPSLLMGHDFHRRQWLSDALTRYEHAYQFDPASRGDPRMLRNLVDMASTQVHARRAGDMVVEIYGPEAIEAVESALARMDDRDRAARLRTLRRRLGGG
jgi:eukaryotic-like serine/threonine-protein kinase